jgi:precorrin-2 dehydrogenase/sirohydrochlorin ferrochelatase
MPYFPAFLNLEDTSCLVVGAGQVGRRKIERILRCGPAELLIVDPGLEASQAPSWADHPAVRIERRRFQPADIEGRFLVIASTEDPALNREISRLCRERGILCNIVDQPDLCSFIVPALFSRGELQLAISTGGASPALARKVRQRMGEALGPEYASLVWLLGRLRGPVLDLNLGSERNKEIFTGLAGDDLLEALQNGDRKQLALLLEHKLPSALHPSIGPILHELDASL